MDYPYSPIQDTNNIQRIIEPSKVIKPIRGKRILKFDIKNINKILRNRK
jgi:hypothetical protein